MPGETLETNSAPVQEYGLSRLAESYLELEKVMLTEAREHEQIVAKLTQELTEKNAHIHSLNAHIHSLEVHVHNLEMHVHNLETQIAAVLASKSWKLTKPIRGISEKLRRG